jgi:polysaccharide biosynthesis protein PelA
MKSKKGLMIILSVLLLLIAGGLLSMYFYGPMFKIKSFQIYYDKIDSQKRQQLLKSDAVIVEPTALSEKDMSTLKAEGIKIFGYVSLMQLENWNEGLKKHIAGSDYAIQEGQRIYINEYDTYVMDLRESHYRDALLWKIEKYVAGQQLDGIFFDTVDDLDYYFHEDKKTQGEMRQGYQQLLEKIKKTYPKLLIIQNRGFETYQSTSRSKIHGLLWEGFEAEDMQTSEWAKNWLDYFKKEQRFGKVRMLTVVTDQKSYELSEKIKFPAFIRKGDTYQD